MIREICGEMSREDVGRRVGLQVDESGNDERSVPEV